MHWYVVYTKPRWEKKVIMQLAKAGIEYYLPIRKVIKQYSDRQKKVDSIVLPSYVFLRIAEEQKTEVRFVSGIVNYVYWQGKPAFIKDKDMETFMAFMNIEGDLQFETVEAKIGDTITLEKEPYAGKQAVVLQKNKNQMVLLLQSLQMRIVIHTSKTK
jgi:transcriptional antiterminator RfaH